MEERVPSASPDAGQGFIQQTSKKFKEPTLSPKIQDAKQKNRSSKLNHNESSKRDRYTRLSDPTPTRRRGLRQGESQGKKKKKGRVERTEALVE